MKRMIAYCVIFTMVLSMLPLNAFASDEPGFTPFISDGLNRPYGVAVDSSGNVYVTDSLNHQIQKFDSDGNLLMKWGSSGSGDGQFIFPMGIAIDGSDNVYVSDSNNFRIQKFNSMGSFLAKWGSEGAGDGEFTSPYGIAVGSDGNVYVSDNFAGQIQKFNSDGIYQAKWGSPGNGDGQFGWVGGVAVDDSDNVYVVDIDNNRIQKFNSNGNFLAKWGSSGSGDGQFSLPYGVAVDGSGNAYVADYSNHRIQKFDSSGNYLAKWGSAGTGDGKFNSPYGIAVDSIGNVYVADTCNNRIQKMVVNNVVGKVAADKAALTWDTIKGTNTLQDSVTSDLTLTVTGAVYASDITWSSDNTAVISNSGVVTRPDFSSGDAAVTVTAAIYNSGESDTKDFSLIVLKLPQTNYTVTFDKNGGDTEADPTTKTAVSGGNIGSLPAAPTRSGYAFTGWNTAANGTGTAFTATTAVNADLTVYAQWLESDFTFDPATGTITGYTGAGGNIEIPATIGGVAVTAIGDEAFYGNNTITGVIIPVGVLNIGESAFDGCSNIESVTLPDGLTSIGDCAFWYCTKLKSITLPDSLTSVGSGMFYACMNLESVNIPIGITELPQTIFLSCESLKSVTMPDNIVSIGGSAFQSCISLPTVKLPANLTSVGHSAFFNCSQLAQAVFTGNAPTSFEHSVFNDVKDSFRIFYSSDSTGFSSPTWNGYASEQYNPAATYTLAYDANGGTTDFPTVDSLHTGDCVIIPNNNDSLVKDGYQFNGWNTNADGTGEMYTEGSTVPIGVENVTLFARWKRLSSVSVDTFEHGSITVDKISAAEGEAFTVTITPDEGWNYIPDTLKFKDPVTGDDITNAMRDLSLPPISKTIFKYEIPSFDILVTAEFAEGDFLFKTTAEGNIKTKQYIGTETFVDIPSSIDGKSVTTIGSYTFNFDNYIIKVKIPSTVTTIEPSAFIECPCMIEAFFEGDAPVLVGLGGDFGGDAEGMKPASSAAGPEGELKPPKGQHFAWLNENFKIYYIDGSIGFTSPTWNGYPSVAIPPSKVVEAEKEYLDIGYKTGDSITAVTQNLYFELTGPMFGSDITWRSDNTAVISNDGVVARPSYENGDANVTVTATITNNGASDTKEFNLVVLKLPQITSYTVTFDKNGGGTEADPTTKTVVSGGNVGTLPTAPTRSGYTFIGWNTAANGTGTAFTAATAVTANITVYAQWTAVPSSHDSDHSSSNSGSSGSTSTTSTTTTTTPTTTTTTVTTDTGAASSNVTSTITAETKSDSNGKAAAAVTESQIKDAVSKAAEAAAKQGEGTAARVEIKVTAPAEAKTVETSLPKAAVAALTDDKIDDLTVTTPVAAITFDKAAIATISNEAAADVKITVSKADTAALSQETKQIVGDRPVFNFSVTSGDRTISQFGGNVTVSVPYTPKAGEDTNAIVIYYINAEGKPEMVSNCKYDPATGSITFTTNHFSMYAVGYNKVSFKDVAANAWYSDAVGFVAARGITTGTGDGNYSPEDKLTRSQILVMVMRAYGIKPEADSKNNFADSGSTYYTGYLAAAKRLGISGGIGNNMFAPEKEITRQEMFTLLYNALKAAGELPQGTEGKTLSSFSDAGQVASWAKDAMTLFVKTGTVSGSGGKLAPASMTTRAEMAQVLYSLLSK